MKIFQYFLNPKIKEDLVIDSVCYDPQNIYEKRLGSLYMVGVLKNALPKNQNFIEVLEKFIKERYYKKSLLKPERALKETLKEANDFLAQLIKEGNVGWLGNISFAILNLMGSSLNFTKVGDLKIYLVRNKKIIDIDKRLKIDGIEPYPLKVFGNIVSGKLIEGDTIMIFSKEIISFFESENLIQKLIDSFPFDEKIFKRLLDENKEPLSKIKGVLFFLIKTKKREKEKKEIISSKTSKEFSLKEFFFSFFKPFLNRKEKEYSFAETIHFINKHFTPFLKNKKLLLILGFIILLIAGYYLFR